MKLAITFWVAAILCGCASEHGSTEAVQPETNRDHPTLAELDEMVRLSEDYVESVKNEKIYFPLDKTNPLR